MLRRFESYGFHETTTPEQVAELERVLLHAGDFIPEVLFSAVGRNESATNAELVWEHAYEGPDAYARYMCHPYHICILDRYLLPESPECITASPSRGGGGTARLRDRRPVVSTRRWDPPARGDEGGAGHRRGDVDERSRPTLEDRPSHAPGLRVSIVAPNIMGLEWAPDGWTHLWEQAYDDEAGDAARARRRSRRCSTRVRSRAGSISTTAWAPDAVGGCVVIHLVDAVDVQPDDLDAYLAAFAEYYLPGAVDRGMELVGCWHTPTDIGEMVTVTVVFRVESWANWELIRNAGVRDPLMSTWVDKRRALMTKGTRRFYESASFSP